MSLRIAILYGNTRRGSTWHAVDLLRQGMARATGLEVAEFAFPRDMPHFCAGCFSCFYKGEDVCPHAEAMRPIREAILGADVLVLASPVYAMDVSGGMKAALDHLCYLWMSHRPDPRMFRKIGVTVATTAGVGLGHAGRTMGNSLRFWGVKRTFRLHVPVSAMRWDEVPAKVRARLERDAARLAVRVVRTAARVDRIEAPLFRRMFFGMMKGMMRKNTWNPRDRSHWVEQGWIPAEG